MKRFLTIFFVVYFVVSWKKQTSISASIGALADGVSICECYSEKSKTIYPIGTESEIVTLTRIRAFIEGLKIDDHGYDFKIKRVEENEVK